MSRTRKNLWVIFFKKVVQFCGSYSKKKFLKSYYSKRFNSLSHIQFFESYWREKVQFIESFFLEWKNHFFDSYSNKKFNSLNHFFKKKKTTLWVILYKFNSSSHIQKKKKRKVKFFESYSEKVQFFESCFKKVHFIFWKSSNLWIILEKTVQFSESY